MEEKLIDLMWEVKEGKKHPNRAYKELCVLFNVSENTLDVPDIRNKLSPITHLISMVERNEPEYIEKAMPQAKISVNYLAQREVYKTK
tara:strand:+ start:2647 stop:2910 length:264 start_codon:yes stop_codon:yes gene_type:complete